MNSQLPRLYPAQPRVLEKGPYPQFTSEGPKPCPVRLCSPKPCPGRGQTHLCQAATSDLKHKFCGCNPLIRVGLPQTSPPQQQSPGCLLARSGTRGGAGCFAAPRLLPTPSRCDGSDNVPKLGFCLEEFHTIQVQQELALTW